MFRTLALSALDGVSTTRALATGHASTAGLLPPTASRCPGASSREVRA